MNILIDKDDVLYEFTRTWYQRHNADPRATHVLTMHDTLEYENGGRCKEHGCQANLFDYFKEPAIWLVGNVKEHAQKITEKWVTLGHDLVIITRITHGASAFPSMTWLEEQFPHIPDMMLVTGQIKHWAIADVLIDDAVSNHRGFRGISILMDHPSNRVNKVLPRATDWLQLDRILNRIEVLLDDYQSTGGEHEFYYHKVIERRIKLEIDQGRL